MAGPPSRTVRSLAAPIVALALAVAAAVPAASTGQRADAGQTPRAPQRIVSLVPALTEMLFAIGAGPQVVGVSSYDRYPAEATARPHVGALLDPDVERIFSLRPDLVAIYGSQVDLKRQLGRAGVAVFDYRHAGLADILTTLATLGHVTGHDVEAATVAAGIERQLAEVRRRTSRGPKVRTLLVFGREPGALRNIYAAGGRGFLHDMLVAAGGENVFADMAQESVQATIELLLARAPDVILEVREGEPLNDDEIRRRIADWARLASIPAVRDGRIVVVSGPGLVVPGPRVADAVTRLARALHPERMAP
ncbi:MAG: helical backbone metal receptor [Vicinamibacterales bacterium]